MSDSAYFERLSDRRLRATEHTGGAWALEEQHIAPMAGLLLHETERLAGADGKVLGRLTLDILGVVGVDEFEVECEVVRPGRTISLLEARAVWAGRTVAVARTWRLTPSATAEVAGGAPRVQDGLATPDSLPAWDMTSVWPGGYIASLDVRREPDAEPGRAVAWVRSPLDLVAGEPVSDLARWVGVLDTANGLSVRESPKQWLFPNLDLTLHLHRRPTGSWVGFDTTVVFGDAGLGLTETVLHDVAGPVGRLAQVLTVRPGA